jgi:hypothetical protein
MRNRWYLKNLTTRLPPMKKRAYGGRALRKRDGDENKRPARIERGKNLRGRQKGHARRVAGATTFLNWKARHMLDGDRDITRIYYRYILVCKKTKKMYIGQNKNEHILHVEANPSWQSGHALQKGEFIKVFIMRTRGRPTRKNVISAVRHKGKKGESP